MAEFKNGEIDVLVATTVIEVGIDVSNATVMLIEHAERFGLAQLHQLRGRVGRGKHASKCFLIASYALTDDGKARLNAIVKSQDGFSREYLY
jgi:ATP-dependent DNA helicase RecG